MLINQEHVNLSHAVQRVKIKCKLDTPYNLVQLAFEKFMSAELFQISHQRLFPRIFVRLKIGTQAFLRSLMC